MPNQGSFYNANMINDDVSEIVAMIPHLHIDMVMELNMADTPKDID